MAHRNALPTIDEADDEFEFVEKDLDANDKDFADDGEVVVNVSEVVAIEDSAESEANADLEAILNSKPHNSPIATPSAVVSEPSTERKQAAPARSISANAHRLLSMRDFAGSISSSDLSFFANKSRFSDFKTVNQETLQALAAILHVQKAIQERDLDLIPQPAQSLLFKILGQYSAIVREAQSDKLLKQSLSLKSRM